MDFSWLFWIIIIIMLLIFTTALLFIRKKKKLYNFESGKIYNFKQVYNARQIKHHVFLVGDMGALPLKKAPITNLLENQMSQCQENSSIVFLGDNIYPHGLPKEDSPGRKEAERRLNIQLDLVKNFKGNTFFITGNHDWNKGKKDGWSYALRQEKYINEKIPDSVFPKNGCPGPVSISLDDNLQIIIINTQWWVQEGEKPRGAKDGCSCEDDETFFELLAQTLQKNKHKKLLVIGHHPLYSNSTHGGKFNYKHHLFPLRAVNKKLYLPLPGVGSLYPLYRKIYGAKEDISFPTYKRMRNKLLKIFIDYPNLVYASGHDHNLQYIKKHEQHYLISGSGSKLSFVKRGGKARYAASKKGFMRLNYLKNGETWLEVWLPVDNGKKGLLAFTALLD